MCYFCFSATNKWRLKFVSMLHLLMAALMLVRLSTPLFVLAGIRPPGMLQRLQLPRAHIWEYAWLMSVTASFMGLFAIKKNRITFMQQYILGTITFGLLPVLYAFYDLSDDMVDYWETNDAKLFHGFPLVVLWNMFLAVVLQIHIFGLYFGWQLIKSWRSMVVRKKVK